MTGKLSKREKEWRTEDDARTLKRYNEIINDRERMDMAKKYLEEEHNNIVTAMNVLDVNNIKTAGII